MGPFLRFDGVGIDEFYTAFAASSDGQPGSLYLADVATGQLLPIADVNTPIPGSNLTFNVSDSPLIDEGRIAFRGYRLESFVPVAGGVYVYDIPTAQITPIIELFDPLPGGDILGEIQFPSISGDTVGFAGRPGDEFGPSTLFAVVDGQVYRIIGEGDTLDGHFVQTLIYRPEGHNGRQFAFAIQSQGSAYGAIYVATLHLPCPADFNSDTLITSADISAFLSAWFLDLASGTLAADFNASGVTGSSDITAFLSAWFAALAGGC
ncbi:MAG: hypothetical protein H7Y88_06025 [Phycisphaerales bacterium]|nr:hypothetical protein [Phycisphaerales bacterium]